MTRINSRRRGNFRGRGQREERFARVFGGTTIALAHRSHSGYCYKETVMFGSAAPYIMSVSMMLFSASSGLVLIAFVRSLDPPELPKDRTITKHAA